jgi:hypothetical protein
MEWYSAINHRNNLIKE